MRGSIFATIGGLSGHNVFLQERRDSQAAKRFFKRLIANNEGNPRKIVTDKLESYRVAHREHIPETIHDTKRFLSTHAEVYNLFNLGRHLVSAKNYRLFRDRAFAYWENAVSV